MTGGYYADVDADCQLFHVCVQVSDYEVYILSFIYFVLQYLKNLTLIFIDNNFFSKLFNCFSYKSMFDY